MAKRVATSELNHDNWDQEEKPEEAGLFRKATDSTMQNRVIRQAKRRSTSSPYSSSESGDTKNAFANFSGFKASPKTSFGSFNFGGSGAATTNGSTNATEASVAAAPASFKFGGAAPINLSTNAAEAPSTGSNFANDMAKKIEEASTVNFQAVNNMYSMLPMEFKDELKSLNMALREWVQINLDINEACVLCPVFQDYEKYVNSLVETYGKEKASNTAPVTSNKLPVASKEPTVQKPFSFSFSASTSTKNIDSGGPASSAKTIFGGKPGDEKSNTEASHIEASPARSIFEQSFASPVQPPAGISSDGKETSALQLSLGSEKPFTFANVSKPPGNSGENENNDKEDCKEPPKAEFTPVVEEDAFFSKRCKVYVKRGGGFVDRGVGTLYLKSVPNSSKTQMIVRADTSLGNILLNTLLFPALSVQHLGNNNVMMLCVPTPEEAPPPIPVLLRVKTIKDAENLTREMEKHIK